MDVFSTIEQDELAHPSTRKILPNRTIYLSRPMPITKGFPILSDFGAARQDDPSDCFSSDVMPGVYRAPEIILDMEWVSSIDIWSIGVMVISNIDCAA